MKTKLFNLAVITFLFFSTSCGVMYKVVFGIDTKPEWNTDEEIVKQATKYDIPSEMNLVLDTTYTTELTKLYTGILKQAKAENDSATLKLQKEVHKDDSQPVQFRLFDSSGNELYKMVNCYVKRGSKWNVKGSLDTFPYKTDIVSLNTHNYKLDFLLSQTSLLNQKKMTQNDLPKADYYAVIQWNEFYKRPSKKLISTIRKVVAKSNQSICIVYINNHNATIWSFLDAENKQIVRDDINQK